MDSLRNLEKDYKLVCKYITEELTSNLEIGKRTISIDEVFDIMERYLNEYPKLGSNDTDK